MPIFFLGCLIPNLHHCRRFFFVYCRVDFQLLHIIIFLPMSSHFSLILFNSRIISIISSLSFRFIKRAFSVSRSLFVLFFIQSNIFDLNAFVRYHGYDHILCYSDCIDLNDYLCPICMRCCLGCADLNNDPAAILCGCYSILRVLCSFSPFSFSFKFWHLLD